MKMGTWGVGFFDNDAAMDWLSELVDQDELSTIQLAIDRVNSVGQQCLDADPAAEGLAAAYVAGLLAGHAPGELPQELVSWMAEHPIVPPIALLVSAAGAVERVLNAPSELPNLWEDSEMGAEWRAHGMKLRDWLRARANSAPT